MKKILFGVIALLFVGNCLAQELNKTVLDEKSQTNILLGYCDRSGLMTGDFGQSYLAEHGVYKPDDAALNLLKSKLGDITFVIVLGTWCSDSKEQVPRFIKLLDCLKYDMERVTFIAVDRTKTAGIVPTADLKIEKVPTIIVYRNSVEIGRIIETPEITLEKDLVGILTR